MATPLSIAGPIRYLGDHGGQAVRFLLAPMGLRRVGSMPAGQAIWRRLGRAPLGGLRGAQSGLEAVIARPARPLGMGWQRGRPAQRPPGIRMLRTPLGYTRPRPIPSRIDEVTAYHPLEFGRSNVMAEIRAYVDWAINRSSGARSAMVDSLGWAGKASTAITSWLGGVASPHTLWGSWLKARYVSSGNLVPFEVIRGSSAQAQVLYEWGAASYSLQAQVLYGVVAARAASASVRVAHIRSAQAAMSARAAFLARTKASEQANIGWLRGSIVTATSHADWSRPVTQTGAPAIGWIRHLSRDESPVVGTLGRLAVPRPTSASWEGWTTATTRTPLESTIALAQWARLVPVEFSPTLFVEGVIKTWKI